MDNTYQGGSLPDSVIQSQINVLSSAYNGSGVSFRLAGVDRTINGNWFTFGGNPNSPFMNQMKQALRRGSVQTLNVYSVGFAEESGGFLGYATFPWDFQQNPSVDGVVFAFSTTPGGSIVGLNQGKILVHEVGHWVGLLHTFEGGCAEPGDYVADTPAEASAARGCPTNRDTCPGGGVDPIQNHMDYTDDSCRQSFTDGQVSRFKKALNQFRGTSL
ncbi:hypothetical protein B0F90DRAFT_1746873 [Multifurca ochricompacta]|uniref:Peptidase M43 pregnancy-associated plasma-A domain-containing protein n=1 Tax=Multifurca ochricompacta TaxID=376703 RepID=A0AAD4M130_9AGAM|nr:hypothetical protein B0F90DRAFT_1746873 [Multifurca ochricompacta]